MSGMERTKWPAITGLVVGTTLLCRSTPTTFALDKPIHTSVVILASCAAAVIGAARLLPKNEGRSHKGQQYDAVPLGEIGQPHSSREPSPSPDDVRYPSSLRKLRILFLVLVVAICLRVELLREFLAYTQCAGPSMEPLVPLAFAVLDYLVVQRHKKPLPIDDNPDSSIYDALEEKLTRAPYRYLVATSLLFFGSSWAFSTTRSPRSTYICPASLPYTWMTPNYQYTGTFLDIVILYCIAQLLHQHEGRGARSVSLRFMSVGWAFLFSAVTLLTVGIVYYIVTERDRKWTLAIPSLYFWSTLRLDVLICCVAICTVLCIYHIGVMSTSTIATFVATSTITTAYAWNHSHPFPPIPASVSFIAICLAILGFASYFHIESVSEHVKDSSSTARIFAKVPSWFYLVVLSLFCLRTGLWASHSTSVTYHPIDFLIFDAQARHEEYINQTSASKTLAQAAQNYRNRYSRHPPPGFQHWYAYATERNSVVIDDYDSVHRDLLPFYSLSPEEIRQRTWQLISNPWNDAAGISIRNGEVAISPNVVPTHRWMLDGLVEMIKNFVEFLPDMDLAFNLNDECRIAVPYENIESLRQTGAGVFGDEDNVRNSFSEGRGVQWQLIPEEPNPETPLSETSWQHTFYEYGSVGCPPGSPARTQKIWDVRDVCIDCAYPQSLGAFLANWPMAADICHQPDLANLHGLYLSPAAFKASHELYPIFSQSKVHGFNDILYPSAWNYIDKARYAPSDEHPDVQFEEKNNTLFWRGATSEGVSQGMGSWRGMTRQRFIHVANNINGSEASQPVLLPEEGLSMIRHPQYMSSEVHRLSYMHLPISELTSLLSTDVHVVDFIARCGGRDCPQQANEFAPLVPPSDFQDHWKYKYLLDLDGAGFSGRFLPFLQSHSLPFKAGIFREWWDDRVTAWQHFVPLDVRGHGLWGTLAYFAGINGTVHGRHKVVEAHELEGERIAERGRNWAEQVLRKEDMEIYFFRLLLEWGRLTDDARDNIGYDVDIA